MMANLAGKDPNLALLTVPELKTLLRAWDVEQHSIISATTKKHLIALVPDGVTSFDVPDEWQRQILREEKAKARAESSDAVNTLAGLVEGMSMSGGDEDEERSVPQDSPSRQSNGVRAAMTSVNSARPSRRPRSKRGNGAKPPPCVARD